MKLRHHERFFSKVVSAQVALLSIVRASQVKEAIALLLSLMCCIRLDKVNSTVPF